jgi:hypothetical protein
MAQKREISLVPPDSLQYSTGYCYSNEVERGGVFSVRLDIIQQM